MKKTVIGIGLGTLAGLVDLIPMIFQKLPINACLSAFSMWLVIGFLISVVELNVHSSLKSIIVALLILLPNSFIIGWEEPFKLLPILIFTLIIGGFLGYFYNRFTKSS